MVGELSNGKEEGSKVLRYIAILRTYYFAPVLRLFQIQEGLGCDFCVWPMDVPREGGRENGFGQGRCRPGPRLKPEEEEDNLKENSVPSGD
jgi:hypothetical protein